MSPMQRQCLVALVDATNDSAWGTTETFVPFLPVCEATGLPRKDVRRSIRALARKGLTKFSTGLCDEYGAFRGSGYAPTEAGVAALAGEPPK